ncbi:MAG: LamB/YcsF family protein, partial [Betaproteobacteria bacterium]
KFFGLAGSVMLQVAKEQGFETVSEVFADRRYGAGGFLVARSKKNALITEVDEARTQLHRLVAEDRVLLEDKSFWGLSAQTVCIHGDGVNAVEFAEGLRGEMDKLGVAVCPP